MPDGGLGHSLANVGDLNGDGWPDVAVGRPGVPPNYSVLSGVRVWLGGPKGVSNAQPWRAWCCFAKCQTGGSLSALGDVNGDGLADFAVASPQYSLMEEGVSRVGRVDIFLGHREGYAQPEKFPMDRVNSSTHDQAIADLTQRAREVTADKAERIQAEVAALFSLAHETRRHQAANSRATRWLRGLAWTAPFVAIGLALAWRWQKRRHAQAAVRGERKRLARDLHDGLGSGLQRMTALLNQLEPGSAEAARLREGLLKPSQELSGSLDRAVGAVKPENDTLENLAGFLAAYAPSLLAPHGVERELDLPAQLPPVPLHGDTRQHLFLEGNEALNNIARHAQARQAWLRVSWREPQFEIVIEDDGMGLSTELARAGRPLGGNGPAQPAGAAGAAGRGIVHRTSRRRRNDRAHPAAAGRCILGARFN